MVAEDLRAHLEVEVAGRHRGEGIARLFQVIASPSRSASEATRDRTRDRTGRVNVSRYGPRPAFSSWARMALLAYRPARTATNGWSSAGTPAIGAGQDPGP